MAGEAEVAHVGLLAVAAGRDENVPGLDVSVHEPCGVGGIESVGDLLDQIECAHGLESAFVAEQLAEIGALDVSHREVEGSTLLAGSESGDDMGVVEARRELGLAQEAAAEAFVPRQLRREQLQRDAPSRSRFRREVNRAHRPFAEERLHAKAGEESARANVGCHRL